MARVTRATTRALQRNLPTQTIAARSRPKKLIKTQSEKPQQLDSSSSETKHLGKEQDQGLNGKKWQSWSAHADASPFPAFGHPTRTECEEAYRVLHELHHDDVEEEFNDPNTPETIPFVLDAMIVAVLSQATSWSNAKRAMNSMKETYGSVFAYQEIYSGGMEKLQETIRCGGLHKRKSMIIMSLLQEVRERHGQWNLDHLFQMNDEDAMKELLSYKYIGYKSAFVVMGWCLKRKSFTVDTHIYRIAGLWGWRPAAASREKTQAHLNAVIPDHLKFDLHFLFIAHGRTCPACRGNPKIDATCRAREAMAK